MNTLQRFELLKDFFLDPSELDRILEKLFDIVLSQYRIRLGRYERELRAFETRYKIDSATFYRRFEAGEMGDAMDFFEWAGLYELRQALAGKIRQLESTV